MQGLKEERHELETTIKEAETGAGSGNRGSELDTASLKRQIQRIDSAIEDRTAETVRGRDKDALIKEETELKEQIALGMPTRYEMNQPTKNPGAVRKHIEWGKRNQKNIERYVQIQRILRPMEPESIETLRKEK
jgi:hypothetical protein